jgi:CubicO group peptidase (beta-lactamase class C family)
MYLSKSLATCTRLGTLVFVFALCAPTLSSQTTPASTFDGVWGAEVRFGDPVQGQLTLDGRGGMWRASIGGFEVTAEESGREIQFQLPDGIAKFRGIQDSASNVMHGEWIQPGGVILDSAYTSPVALHRIAPAIWRGNIIPLEQRTSVYLFVSTKDGKTVATASNPESNFFRRRLYRVERDGAKVMLQANGKQMQGSFDEKSGVLSLQVVNWLPPFQFTRRTTETAVGFYPRTPFHHQNWTYIQPVPDGDGWRTASLREEGLDEKPITELIDRILATDPTSTALKIQSLLIARHGHLVLDEYFYGFDESRVHDMRSASKTFAPMLVGVAQEHGVKLTPQQPLYPLFIQYKSFANADARKAKITLRDVMTMTAGNACGDNDDASPGNEDNMEANTIQPDWYSYTLDLPMVREPGGSHAVYCSGDLNLVGGAVAAVTHQWLPALFDEAVARPLQFGRYYLNLMPDGQAYMGGGAYLRPRDQLKLGQLYLDGGLWNSRRIVSKQWVQESTSIHSHFDPRFSLGQQHDYGYGWHIHDLVSGTRAHLINV